jgi:hypothetical protein
MSTERCTIPETATLTDAVAQAACEAETFRPWSSNRNEGIIWAEGLLSQARTCSGDAARFAAKL